MEGLGAGVGITGRAETCESVERPRPEFETQDPGPVPGLGQIIVIKEAHPFTVLSAWGVFGQRTL